MMHWTHDANLCVKLHVTSCYAIRARQADHTISANQRVGRLDDYLGTVAVELDQLARRR